MTDLLLDETAESAKRLLGCELIRTLPEGEVRVKIVEVELYRQDDAASHSFSGNTPRTSVMFGPPGYTYVYFTYGLHYCFNITIGRDGRGAAVLIRAVEPVQGHEIMAKYRPLASTNSVLLTNGPAKLCQALNIDKQLNGHSLENPPLKLKMNKRLKESEIVTTRRIGISKAIDMPWRFYIKNNPYISKK